MLPCLPYSVVAPTTSYDTRFRPDALGQYRAHVHVRDTDPADGTLPDVDGVVDFVVKAPEPELTTLALTDDGQDRLQLSVQLGAQVLDLHLWRLGPGHHAAIVVLTAPDSRPVNHYHARLNGLDGLSHVTIEVRDHPKA